MMPKSLGRPGSRKSQGSGSVTGIGQFGRTSIRKLCLSLGEKGAARETAL